MDDRNTGRVTIPTDVDVVEETLKVMERWGADAVRDCDGTDMPQALKSTGAKVYTTYYTTRKDNPWANAHPDEIQQCYLMTRPRPALGAELAIPLMEGRNPQLIRVNHIHDPRRWWEVVDRTTGEVVPPEAWQYDREAQTVTLSGCVPFHEYTVAYLAFLIWDSTHMYNTITNGWTDVEHQLTYDVRLPATRAYVVEKLGRFLRENPDTDVVRFTTFFHQFFLLFDQDFREQYVDWYGYSASVSPHILERFEWEAGYPFRPEFIVDQGYHNCAGRVPAKEYLDFVDFQSREVAALAGELVALTHKAGKEAMMFLGDHWIGTEPYGMYFSSIGLDAVVGSVGNGATLRLIADIPGVRYTEGRLLPYFFPDTFHQGGDPVREARENWMAARRAILRKPVDRIGYGGYLKLALGFPDFLDYVEKVCHEFRALYQNVQGTTPWCAKRVAVLNCWGRLRSWGNHMVHHGIYHQENIAYFGVIEALSGLPLEVSFLSFQDIQDDPRVLENIDVVINCGAAYTAQSGGEWWARPEILAAVRAFVHRGGGFIGVGEPSACQGEGQFFRLSALLGVEKEVGFTLGYGKYNREERPHFITEEYPGAVDFGEGARYVYALEGATVLCLRDRQVQLAVNEYGGGRSVYLGGLPYSHANARLLYRAVLWAAGAEKELHRWYSSHPDTEAHAYPGRKKYCVANNAPSPRDTTVWRGDGSSFSLSLASGEIRWFDLP